MPFWVCHYHVVWATKDRQPLLVDSVETTIYDVIKAKSDELDCPIDAINGASDHIHVAVRIKPSLAVGTWVAQVKGASSRAINMNSDAEKFRWQESYGALTFGAKTLSDVVGYIAQQKERHRTGQIEPYLERIED